MGRGKGETGTGAHTNTSRVTGLSKQAVGDATDPGDERVCGRGDGTGLREETRDPSHTWAPRGERDLTYWFNRSLVSSM